MSNQGLTVKQAAAAMGKSQKTIYRWMDTGKLEAQKIKGEWRIFEIPDQVTKERPTRQTGQRNVQNVQNEVSPLAMDIIRELQDKNLQLAAQLGAATERIRTLDSQVKLLTAGKQSKWQGLIARIKRKLARQG